MAASNQICQMNTITLARAVAAKELSPVEAVERSLIGWTGWTPPSTCSPGSCPTSQEDGQAARDRDCRRARGRPARRGADRGEGSDLYEGDPHGFRVVRLRRFRAR